MIKKQQQQQHPCKANFLFIPTHIMAPDLSFRIKKTLSIVFYLTKQFKKKKLTSREREFDDDLVIGNFILYINEESVSILFRLQL